MNYFTPDPDGSRRAYEKNQRFLRLARLWMLAAVVTFAFATVCLAIGLFLLVTL